MGSVWSILNFSGLFFSQSIFSSAATVMTYVRCRNVCVVCTLHILMKPISNQQNKVSIPFLKQMNFDNLFNAKNVINFWKFVDFPTFDREMAFNLFEQECLCVPHRIHMSFGLFTSLPYGNTCETFLITEITVSILYLHTGCVYNRMRNAKRICAW